MRARDHGIVLGLLPPGPANAITDVAGVRVGHCTLIRGNGPRVVGKGPVRTGVTVVIPHDGDPFVEPVFAGCHILNGNGEMTGLAWVREAGLLTSPVAITNTHSVGVVRDALVRRAAGAHPSGTDIWSLPVVGETSDGLLNDMNGFHVRPEHLNAAMDGANTGPVAEGAVGGGTGMICHEFKGGIGTASRRLPDEAGGWTVGVLVQANYGRRELLRIDGVPVGQEISLDDVPSPWRSEPTTGASPLSPGFGSAARAGRLPPGSGSIIIVVATDAPLLPHQCRRLAQRAGLGLARLGSFAGNTSGDLFLAFATGNRDLPLAALDADPRRETTVRYLNDATLDPVYLGTVEATEEAIVNALLTAGTMTGCDGATAHGLEGDRVVEILARYGRGPAVAGHGG